MCTHTHKKKKKLFVAVEEMGGREKQQQQKTLRAVYCQLSFNKRGENREPTD